MNNRLEYPKRTARLKVGSKSKNYAKKTDSYVNS